MYGKIFESTYTGSLFGSGFNVHAVWAYVIAHCKPDSMVEINPKIVSAVLGGPVQDVIGAIDFLCAEDPGSRSKAEGGRRLVREGEYLYRVVNYNEYHTLRNNEERREYNRIKKQESRSRAASNDVNASVIDMSAVSAHTDTDTVRRNRETIVRFDQWYKTYPRHEARKKAEVAWLKLTESDRMACEADVNGTVESLRPRAKTYIPLPASYINGRRWEDEAASVSHNPHAPLIVKCFRHGYFERCGVNPVMDDEDALTTADSLLGQGNDYRLVGIVSYWWGKSPIKRQLEAGFSAFQFLPKHFDDMYRSLCEERINLDLDSPKLPIAGILGNTAEGQNPPGEMAAVSGGGC